MNRIDLNRKHTKTPSDSIMCDFPRKHEKQFIAVLFSGFLINVESNCIVQKRFSFRRFYSVAAAAAAAVVIR